MLQYELGKKLLLCSSIILVLGGQAFAGPRMVGNGGAGLVRKDKVLSFGSAQIPLHSVPSLQNLPGLKEATAAVESLNISSDLKSKLSRALFPTAQRQYFLINPSDIPEATYKKLISEYAQAAPSLNVGSQPNLVLLAITSHSDTYLLPNFFKLEDQIGQAALLFHEALWVLNADFPVATVVNLEIAFEKYLRGKNDVAIYYDLVRAFTSEDDSDVIEAYLEHDLKQKTGASFFEGSGTQVTVDLKTIFGSSLVDLDQQLISLTANSVYQSGKLLNVDQESWSLQLEGLLRKNPSSLFLLFLAQNTSQLQPVLAIGNCVYGDMIDDSTYPRVISFKIGHVTSQNIDGEQCTAGYGADCLGPGYTARVFTGNDLFVNTCHTNVSIMIPQLWNLEDDIQIPHTQVDIDHGLLLDEKKVDAQIEN